MSKALTQTELLRELDQVVVGELNRHEKVATEWFQRAADQGHTLKQYGVAHLVLVPRFHALKNSPRVSITALFSSSRPTPIRRH